MNENDIVEPPENTIWLGVPPPMFAKLKFPPAGSSYLLNIILFESIDPLVIDLIGSQFINWATDIEPGWKLSAGYKENKEAPEPVPLVTVRSNPNNEPVNANVVLLNTKCTKPDTTLFTTW